MAQESNLRTGDQRIITANAPATGYQFAGWTGDITALADPTQPSTIVTIGTSNVTVTATYSLIPVTGGPPTKYVSLTGSDSNAGDIATPWRTPAKAFASVVTAGWRIMIMNGTYSFNTLLPLSPGVSVEGESRTGVILISSYVGSNTDETDGSIQLKSASYVAGNQTISKLTLTGNNLTSKRGIAITYRSSVVIHDCTISDFKYTGIWFKGSNKAWDIEPVPYCSGNGVHNCTVTNCATRDVNVSPMPGSASLRINGQFEFFVRDCTFNQVTRQSQPVGENVNGNIIGGEWNKALKIYRCTLNKRDVEDGWNFFMELWRWTGGGEIYECNFYGAACLDIVDVYKSSYAHGIDIHNNNFYTASGTSIADPPNGSYSINLETKFNLDYCYIYDNYFKNIPNCIEVDWRVYTNESVGLTSLTSTQVHIYRNVMENCGSTNSPRPQISLEATGTNSAITVNQVRVYNNTIKSIGGSSPAYAGINLMVFGTISNCYIQNNIIVGCRRPIEVSTNGGSTPANMNTLVIQNNLYHASTSANSVNFLAGVTYTPAYVNQGQIVADPLFVSATDYHLQSNSPAINVGVNVGLSYVGSAPDLGAYESNVTTGGGTSSNIYYVSQTLGNDSNSGTTTNTPWKTIAKVNGSTFAAGTQILFLCGDTWAEQLVVPSSGSAGSPITFDSYGTGALPIITGSNTRSYTIDTNDKSWITIDSLNLINALGTSINDGSINVGGVSVVGIVIKDCVIANNRRCGIVCKGTTTATSVTISNCIINNNGAHGIYVPNQYTTGKINNNQIYSNGTSSLADSQQVSNVQGDLSNFDIHDNTIHGAAPGTASGNTICHGIYHYSTSTSPASIYHNTIYSNLNGSGIRCKHNADIYNNWIYGNRIEGLGLGDNGTYNATYNVHNNVFRAGTLGYPAIIESTKGTGNIYLYLYNNTFYKNGSLVSTTKEISILDDFTEIKIKNNLFYSADAHGAMYLVAQSHLACDYNLYWKDTEGGVPNITYGAITYTTLANWQAFTFETNGKNVNPLLVNPPNDLHLQNTSPCINAGIDVGITVDFDGVTIVGAPDIGAYENAVGTGGGETPPPTGSTYYISSTGSDSNSGQQSTSPWQTLAKVNATAFPAGSSVLFKKGDEWYGQLIPRSGTSAARITYDSYGTGNRPLIHAYTRKESTSDWVVDGTLYRSTSTFATEVGNILFNESFCGARKWGSGDLTSQGNWYFNMTTRYLYIRSTSNPASFYTNIRLLHVVIPCYMNNKSYINIHNIEFSYTGYNGIQVQACRDITVYNCALHWIGGLAFGAPTRAGNAIEVWNDGGSTTENIIVEYNTISDVFDAGISNQGTIGTQRNIAYRFNLIYNCEYSYEYFMDEGSVVQNIRFDNNTCVDAGLSWGHSQRTNPTGRSIRIARTPSNTQDFAIRNNIFSGSTETLNYTREVQNNLADFTFSNNLYHLSSGPNVATIMLTPYATLTAYRNAYPMWEQNSIQANPLFVNAAARNYNLQTGSPAINAGASIGLPYNGLAPDIGCFETSSAVGTYYVASNGSDSNAGTSSAAPWKTLAKVNSSSFTAGNNILFRRGDTFYGSLTISNSGNSTSPITIGAYGTGSNPIITGFNTVTDWVSVGTNLWDNLTTSQSADMSNSGYVSNRSVCNMVSVNNVNTAMGRYPNATDANGGYLTINSHASNTSITCSTLTGTPNWAGADAVVRSNSYIMDTRSISSQSGSTITLSSGTSYGPVDGWGFFIQNDVRCLTVQNEWYYNPSTHKIRMYSTTKPTNVKVASIDYLLTITGSYVTVNSVDFTGANINAIYTASTTLTNNKILYCNISFSGRYGIRFRSNGLNVEYNTITDSNNRAISVSNSSNAVVSHNTILNSGMLPGMAEREGTEGIWAAMYVGNIVGLTCEYNSLTNVGYTGITFGGATSDNATIKYNFVDNYCAILDDGGAIYGGRNSLIEYNIVVNGIGTTNGSNKSGTNAVGIYLDDNSQGNIVRNNSVYRTDYIGIYLHNSSNNTVANNTVYDSSLHQFYVHDDAGAGSSVNNIFTGNIFVCKGQYQYAAYYRFPASIYSMGTVNYNYYMRPINETTPIRTNSSAGAIDYTLAGWRTVSGHDANSYGSPFTISTESDLRFEYNKTTSPVTINLGQNYRSVSNLNYTSITLQPFTSMVLMKHTP